MDKELPVSAWPEWKIVEKIGEGSFGQVYKAQRTERGKSFYSAIKIINIPGSQSELNSVRSETGNDQAAREYFQNLVEECIQEIGTMEYFRGNSYIVSVEDFKVMEYLDAHWLGNFHPHGVSYKFSGLLCREANAGKRGNPDGAGFKQGSGILQKASYHSQRCKA